MNSELATFLIATLPALESRVAIPLALYFFKIPQIKALFISIFGNLLIVPLVFFTLKFLELNLLKKFAFSKKFSEKILQKLRKQYSSCNFNNLMGLTFFVAIPFPGTGAFTATLISFCMGISFKMAFFSISMGVFLSAIFIWLLAKLGIIFFEKNLVFQVLFFLLCLFSLFLLFFRKENGKK